jgi:phosphoenolpyruvate carboxykinase (ATP)
MKKHNTNAWLVNTGWSGGKYGVGKRMSLKITRGILDAIHSGALEKAKFHKMPIFGVQIPESCPGVDNKILDPINTWANKDEYNKTLKFLGEKFIKNFKNYEDQADPAIKTGGPQL